MIHPQEQDKHADFKASGWIGSGWPADNPNIILKGTGTEPQFWKGRKKTLE
jgi:hypothetical protein